MAKSKEVEKQKMERVYQIVSEFVGNRRFDYLGEVFQFVSENIPFKYRLELRELQVSIAQYNQVYERFLRNAKKTKK